VIDSYHDNSEQSECWMTDNLNLVDLYYALPVIVINLDGATIFWEPQEYLYKSYNNDHKFCLGFLDDGSGSSVIGAITMRGHDVIFDRTNNRVGWA
jgi:hypothetical protein